MDDEESTEIELNGETDARLSIRMSQAELDRFLALQKAIQKRVGRHGKVTQRAVFLEAVVRLEEYNRKLARDKRRKRGERRELPTDTPTDSAT